jgi:hypothetical protein
MPGVNGLQLCRRIRERHSSPYQYIILVTGKDAKQDIVTGRQKERPDYWASAQSPWLIEHQDESYVIPVYGRVEHAQDRSGKYNPMWLDWKVLIGVPHDLPIVGQDGRTVNTLRLFSARASDEFDIRIFNDGDYMSAVEQKMASETVSKVLYPSDAIDSGRYLRLTQEYFLVACSIRDIFWRYLARHSDLREFADSVAIQMNDTHPALTVAELMRTLIDEYAVEWDEAWQITQATCGYTNHTLADTLGANAAASLAFNDAQTASQILSALHLENDVVGAYLYDTQGHLFAEYHARIWRSELKRKSIAFAWPAAGFISLSATSWRYSSSAR